MTLELLTIIDGEVRDDALYPVMSVPGAAYPIEITPEDGNVVHLGLKHIAILDPNGCGSPRRIVDLPSDITWELLITDAHVVVYCVKYDRGGGWWGIGTGTVIALGANMVSHALAAHRRKGTILSGHIRYNWLHKVGGRPKNGWLDNETVRIVVDTGSGSKDTHPLFL